ncbi:MAG: HAMP domain-containing histidine kinase [Prevotella sp.]|nr:HAMP domain-containing histidine kinase [Prevotella sp.]
MKLLHAISLRLLALTAIVLAFWSFFFYFEMIEEVNDEVDDTLEDYAEAIIVRSLAGEEIPTVSIGTNNQFFQKPVSEEYARQHKHIRYSDRDVFIHEKNEYEPARVLSYIYQDNDGQFHELEVSTPHIDKDDLRETIFYAVVVLFGSLLLSVIAVSVFSIHRTMRPLRRLLRWVENFQIGKKSQPLDNPTRIREFAQLNTTVEESMMRSQQLFEQQKTFLGNASHELQTPIAATMNRLEMLINDDTLSEAQMGSLLKAIHSLENMSQLNRSLLTFSKIENGQFNDAQGVDFTRLAEEILTELQPLFALRKITVEKQWRASFVPAIDPTLARMMLTNLMKNAFVHNRDGGTIVIESRSQRFSIANDGQEQPLDAEKIFEPFFRNALKSQKTEEEKNTSGIGLALVRAICIQSNLTIRYDFENSRHHFHIS